jgi:hypothetical protein
VGSCFRPPESHPLRDHLIDVSRGKPAAREYIDALPEGWAISQISALELIVGARDNQDLADIDTFLSAYVIVPLRGPQAREPTNSSNGTRNLTAYTSLIRWLRLSRSKRGSRW